MGNKVRCVHSYSEWTETLWALCWISILLSGKDSSQKANAKGVHLHSTERARKEKRVHTPLYHLRYLLTNLEFILIAPIPTQQSSFYPSSFLYNSQQWETSVRSPSTSVPTECWGRTSQTRPQTHQNPIRCTSQNAQFWGHHNPTSSPTPLNLHLKA